ncbi:PREDICTED: thymidine phosphorylase-like [Priapulus caudatus]|uniref:Thymidine phosphorylase n=1 Tax=Priapulus caudatus TaxID=37621 RepID=A0ABM1DZ94_PRICU|nr:PREDICTED: thymidine phosphorylase-like [Priapulus caudatus]
MGSHILYWFVDCTKDVSCNVTAQLVRGALLMAIYLHGLTASETSSLTRAMTYSGETLHWPLEWNGCVVDKHSTGGVGDKVSLALAPALAACGVKVPMISGRGLGHTGGTLDKLESIPGFCSSITADQIRNILANVGCCIVGQTKDIVPADRVLYAMRDVSSTVDSLPLIASSIVSKKAAENLTALVLDVKYGRGAFMEKEADARSLAETMVEASNSMGVKTVALLTNMNNPIGFAVGNHLEVIEAIRCLHGNGPADLQYLVGQLGGRLLYKAGKVTSSTEGVNLILEKLQDKSALHTFRRMCVAQGAAEETMKELCSENADFTKLFRQSKFTTQLRSPVTGYVHQIDALWRG